MRSKQKIAAVLERFSSPVRGIWPRLPDALIGICAFGIVTLCCLTYSTSLSRHASEIFTGNKYIALIDGLFNPFRNRQLLLHSGLRIYDLKISHQEYAKVEQVVEQNIKHGWMTEDAGDVWAKAQFIYEGQKYGVKVRVRGALPPHWAHPKKSWRIKFGNEKIQHDGKVTEEVIYFQGKRQINLVVPNDKFFGMATFINDLLHNYKLVTMRDRFVILRINGIVQGLYYEVEQFDKPLFAAQNRPETSLFGQNGRAMHFEQYSKYGTPITSDAQYDLGSVERAVDRESDLGMRAIETLNEHERNPTPENFRRARAVLDWEKYLRFRCITTLCNTNHVRFGSDNLKLYYDPSKGLLEPIPWDVLLVKLPKEPGTIDYWNNHGSDELEKATLLDPLLRLQRNKMLWEWVGDGGDSLMAKYNAIHDAIRPYVWADVLNTPIQGYKMDQVKKELDYNVRRVYTVLKMSSANFVYKLESQDRAAIEIASINFSGIQLRQIQLTDSLLFSGKYRLYEDRNNDGRFDASDSLVAETTAENGKINLAFAQYIFPELKYRGDIIENRYWEFFDTLTGRRRFFLVGKVALPLEQRDPLEWKAPKIKVVAVNAVTEHEIPSGLAGTKQAPVDNSIGITAVDMSDPWDVDAEDFTLNKFLQRHPEFVASQDHPGAVEITGKITISGAVIIPKSVPLILKPGADITMKPRASVVCYGGLTSIGTPEQRIRIHGDASGIAWGTFSVVRPRDTVVVKYTDIQNGGQAQINATLFTGGFAVHNGSIDIEYTRITHMQSEDAINVKNGHVFMNECLISYAAHDAFDFDFCNGEVRNSHFTNTGPNGDGLDFSGSYITVTGCRFENIGDKGNSVGENSHPIMINNLYYNCNIGFSSKDLSSAKVAFCTFINNNLAIEAKRKKPFFGGATANVVSCIFSGNKDLLEEDYFSHGGVEVRNSLFDVPVNWPGCKTTELRFVAPEQNNYLLEPSVLASDGFEVSMPEWAHLSGNGHAPQLPGIFSNPVRLFDGRSASMETNPEKILKAEFTK
jgi:CotH kinase protein/Right handed beta helix region